MASSLPLSAAIALHQFEERNGITEADAIYAYDDAANTRELNAEGWARDPKFFKKVKMSALALMKLLMHARSGGRIEVMGLLQGKIVGDTMIVMDAFALPVEGTETRVNAHEAAFGYMFAYPDLMKKVGRLENILGWYHSHPGYGCWLSGIDVGTQQVQQQGMDPFLAIVVDPVRTCAAGKVEVGAFRCYPAGYTPPDAAPSQYQSIPAEKIADFGVHASAYYSLPITYFKSSVDRRLLELLWNKYWAHTLSASPLFANAAYVAGQITDLGAKLEDAGRSVGAVSARSMFPGTDKGTAAGSPLSKCSADSVKVTIESLNGLITHMVKQQIFNGPAAAPAAPATLPAPAGHGLTTGAEA